MVVDPLVRYVWDQAQQLDAVLRGDREDGVHAGGPSAARAAAARVNLSMGAPGACTTKATEPPWVVERL